MVHSYIYTANGDLRDNPGLHTLKVAFEARTDLIWVDLEDPSEKELRLLAEVFGFHPLVIEDCRHHSELPKIDEFSDYLFIVLHAIVQKPDEQFEASELDIFCGTHFLVTVHASPIPLIGQVREKYLQDRSLFSRGVDFLLHELLDALVDSFFPLVGRWEAKIEGIEDRVVSGHTRKILDEILFVRRNLLQFRRSISAQLEVFNRLTDRRFKLITSEAETYFNDIYDHILRLYELLEIQRELLGIAFEAYLSVISTHMNELSQRSNRLMARLTAVATIFLPLTFLVGVYGMNFRHMPELEWRYGYFVIWGVMVAVGLGLWIFFKRRKWI